MPTLGKHSSNKDLRALCRFTRGVKFLKVSLRGDEAESILTNSANLARIVEASKCRSSDDPIREIEKEVRGEEWEEEQHMVEEDRFRSDWKKGGFGNISSCKKRGGKNAWDQKQQRCQKQCEEAPNALQASPYAAWGAVQHHWIRRKFRQLESWK